MTRSAKVIPLGTQVLLDVVVEFDSVNEFEVEIGVFERR